MVQILGSICRVNCQQLLFLEMITDIQIFTALVIALTAAILAIGLGRQLYV